MLHRIIGKSGSGKTQIILNKIKECISVGQQCIVIVPEQQSVAYERKLSSALGDTFNMYCEVLNFERLPNRIARQFGGLNAEYMDIGCRNVLLASALYDVKDSLTQYALSAEDNDFIKKLGQTAANLKMRGITPDMLLEAKEKIPSSSLAQKLTDIGIILKEYEKKTPESLYDPNDGLTRLALREDTPLFFEGKTVFIDSCYTYTPQEEEIIKIILQSAKDAYISFLIGEEPELYRETTLCSEKIKEFSPLCEDIVLTDNKRAKEKSIEYLQDFLWDHSAPRFEGNADNVKIVSASDVFEEAAAVSSIIHSLIRKGYRYRDITVITEGAEKYDGIIDTVLASDGIPCYMSVKDELTTKPVVAFVLAALEIAVTDFAPYAVSKYIKNSYCDLNARERDMLSRYADTWGIRGKRWRDGNPWMMNPEGYTGALTEHSAHVLNTVNTAKEKMTDILLPVYETLISKDLTVKSGVEALYGLLISAKADKRLLARARVLMDSGKERESDVTAQVWDTLIDIFDRLVSVCGEEKTTPEKLHRYLSLMISSRKVGAIPALNDSVTIGNASLIRPENCRACILMGVNDGEFPKAVRRHGLFDEPENRLLEQAGIPLALPLLRQQNEQRFYFTAAVSAPAEKLYITYPAGDLSGNTLRPSVAVMRVKELLGIKETKFLEKETDMLYCLPSAKRYGGGIQNPYIQKALYGLWEEKDGETGLYQPEATVELEQTAFTLTPSRTDKYASCPFSFFVKYLLKLKENKKAAFSAPEIGTFVHSILEEFVSARVEDGKFVPLPDGEREKEVDRLTETYILSVAGEYAYDKRFAYAVSRFKKTLNLIIKNISAEFEQSRFCPSGFEVKIGMGDLPPVEIKTEKGKIFLRGIVDRTDTCVIDGKTYLRVIDYKTGDKRFSEERVEKGLDLQLLMYLFACCSADKTGNTLPAGVLYMPASAPKLDGEKEHPNPDEEAVYGFKKSGLVLADPEVIRAMEAEGGGVFIPAKLNKDGTVSARSVSAKTLEEFDALEDRLKTTLRNMGERLISGDMCISPLKEGSINACRYCEYKSFCRKE
ncbi:MAG: PD-(D/E)XK nuclease family protein [Clostridia bacterium]|nr:PD-(D/E)XK nuclease family protein [Clostridia bacterium]